MPSVAKLLVWLIIATAAPAFAFGQEIPAPQERAVSVTPPQDPDAALPELNMTLEVRDPLPPVNRYLTIPTAVPYSTREALRMGLYKAEAVPLRNQRLLIKETLKLGAVLTIVDLLTGRVVDRISGYEFTFSSDMSRVAYVYRAPSHALVDQVVAAYDLTRDPAENTLSHTMATATASLDRSGAGAPPLTPSDPAVADRGIILYPPLNQATGRFLSTSQPLQTIASPFAWCGNERLAFLSRKGIEATGEISLVVLEVPAKLTEAKVIAQLPLDKRLLLRPEYQHGLPSEYEHYKDTAPPAQALWFEQGCESISVVPFGGHPWVQHPVTIRVDGIGRSH